MKIRKPDVLPKLKNGRKMAGSTLFFLLPPLLHQRGFFHKMRQITHPRKTALTYKMDCGMLYSS